MNITRRQFNRMIIWGGASFTASTTSGIFFPKPAEAYSLDINLNNFSANQVFNAFQTYCAARPIPGALSGILQGNNYASSYVDEDVANLIRTADESFVNRGFIQPTELGVTGTGIKQNANISRLWGRNKQDNLGPNVGFGFVEMTNSRYNAHKISGPTMCGIHNAQQVLADLRLTPKEIVDSLVPTRLSTLNDDWGTWDGDADGPVGRKPGGVFAEYNTATGYVTSEYKLIKPGAGGFGRVRFTMEGENQPRRTVLLTVNF